MLDTGAVLVFGSDWPVVSLNPFLGIEAAVTGRTLDGRAWQTQENITVGEALRCYTSAGAYAVFAEDQIGRIAPGYRADFVVLNRSPFDPDVDWSAVRPDAVYIEGRLEYSESETDGQKKYWTDIIVAEMVMLGSTGGGDQGGGGRGGGFQSDPSPAPAPAPPISEPDDDLPF